MVQVNLPLATIIQIVTFLFPGFLALKVRDGLTRTEPEPRKSSEAWLPALLLDLPILLLLLMISKYTSLNIFSVEGLSPITVILALSNAFVIGLIAGVAEERSIFYRLMRFSRLSRKSWRNPWADTFKWAEREAGGYDNCWVVAHLKNGTRILGWPKYYSADSDNPEIFLARGKYGDEPVRVVPSEKDKVYSVKGPGVLLTPQAEITRLEFLQGSSQKNPE